MINNTNVNNGFAQGSGPKNVPFFNKNEVSVDVDFTIAPAATNVCEITVSILDGLDDLIPSPHLIEIWLSDAATGLGLTAVTASGNVTNKTSFGAVFSTLTAKKALLVQTIATGVFVLSITDTAKSPFFICVKNPFTGLTEVSRQLVTGDYGA